MATYSIVKLKNITPTHLGTGKEHYDFSSADLQSDTISSALAAIRAQRGKSDDIEKFMNSFALSSAFPFYESVYFLPKIQGKLDVLVEGKDEVQVRKELKKVKYIELSAWQQLASSKQLSIKEAQLKNKYLLGDLANFQLPSKSQVSQRVTVPRADGQDADPFYFDWNYFHEKAGLYCIIDAQGELLDEIVELFKLLGESGIGTDRNVGGGKFEVEKGTVTIETPQHPNASVMLSLFVPTEQEMKSLNLNKSKYEILLRGGYIAGSSEEELRHLRKKSIYMFGVGSVFPTTSTLVGKIVNLTPEWNDTRMHQVYRSGKPFYLNIIH